MHYASLHPHALAVVGDNPAEISREIDHQATAKRFAGETRAGTAGLNRQMVFRGVANRGDHVVDRPRTHNTERSQLVDACVAGVQLREYVVATHVALA